VQSSSRILRAVAALTAVLIVAQGFLGTAPAAATTPSQVTDTFGFDSGTLQSFTVPANVTSLTITLTGGQGSWGGADASGNPPPGGYQGEVTGTIAVSPGDYLTIAVGSGGDEPYYTACTTGQDASSPSDPYDAVGGENPLSQYDGGGGGAAGPNGCSGYGGSGGAASVVEVGTSSSSPSSLGTIVAGGGGGDGGSGQYVLVRGQIGLANYVAQLAPTAITYGMPAGCTSNCTSYSTIESPSPLPVDPTQGQVGTAVFTMCGGSTNGENADQYFNTGAPDSEPGCDGGGGAGGGGGAAGGSAGSVQFGSGSSDEWYGQGGSPGENSTDNFSGLSAFYSYYSDADEGRPSGTGNFADPGASYDGSVAVTYATGIPGAPTNVTGTIGNQSVSLQWAAPSSQGATSISDFVVQYSSNGGSTWSTYDTASTATSATITGLTNGTGYIFEVQAVNSVGSGPFSSPSSTFTPSGPPGAPVISSVTPEDGGLVVNFTPPSSGTPISGYVYQLDGSGPWLPSSQTTSPLTISGLSDGTSYSVEIEAVNSIGTGPASNSVSQTPLALPGPPTITSVQVGPGTASVNFTPGATGGGTITGYQYSTNGGAAWTSTSTSSPISLSGLSNGMAYNFLLEAVNASGAGTAATTSFTAPSVPGAPVISSIVPGDQVLSVTLTPPSSGGYPVADYQWSTDGGTTWYSEASFGTPCQNLPAGTVTCQILALSSDGSTPLTNGTPYSIEMRAVNLVGAGPASTAQPATPYTVPGAPAITTPASGMVAANQSLALSFNPPASNGGSTITSYQYSTDAGTTWQPANGGQPLTSTAMTITVLSTDGITPLTNGTTYDVEIRAVNAAGPGLASAVAQGVPSTVPAAPVISSLAPGDGTLEVTFAPGANNGAAVTAYEYSIDGGNTWTPTGSLSTQFTIAGLTNGTSYSVETLAINADGSSPPSAPVAGAPVTEPAQPVITATSRGNATIDVSYSESSTGGSPITSYQYSTDGGTTWCSATSIANPLVVTALSTNGTTPIVNGTTYPVEVRAVNAAGDSVASAPVNVAPAAPPSAPNVTLTAGDGIIGVAVTVPNNGGSPVTEIDYSLNGGAFVPAGTVGPGFTISGLTDGTSYTVSVRADNAIGDGTASSPTSAVPSTVPGPPTGVIAASDSASSDVTWSAPTFNGGSAITAYTATAYTSPSGTTSVGTPCTTSMLGCTITGLTNGTTYYVGAIATNADGSSLVSSPLQAVIPVARPSAPVLTGTTAGGSYLSVAFTAGAAGGDPITSYQYSLDGGVTWYAASGTTSPIVISGLVDGTTYTVALRALSAAGAGATSNTIMATPYTYPGIVDASTIAANGENDQIVLSWTVPSNGGSAITQAQATAFSSVTGGSQDGTCTTTTNLAVGDTASCTITGLSNGTIYYVSVQSDNAAGWSGRSSPRVAVTPSLQPGQVEDLTAVAGDGQASLSWQAGSTGGSAISNYTIWYSSGGVYTQFNNGTSTATTATVTSLTNGTPYTFEVYAVNSYGTGPVSGPSNQVTPEGPSITSPALGDGEVGLPYSTALSASGGTGTFSWSVSNGSLPPGLSLGTSSGEVSGTPSATGTSNFTLEVTDSAGGSATQAETVEIVAAPAGGPSIAPVILTTSLPGGEDGVPYSEFAVAGGGLGPYVWSIVQGSLPAGLVLAPLTGQVHGTPTGGSSTFQLQVTDSLGLTAERGLSIAIVKQPHFSSPELTITGYVGWRISHEDPFQGETQSDKWTVVDGRLPYGLALSPGGYITGSPLQAGTFKVVLGVSDPQHQLSTQTLTFDIMPIALNSRLIVAGPQDGGYWVATNDGHVMGFGNSHVHGDLLEHSVRASVVGIAGTPDGNGYWLVTAMGAVYSFGDAHPYGNLSNEKLTAPIVGIADTPDGRGYWLVAANGSVFTFGDAHFYGSMASRHLNAPVVGLGPVPDGEGYWLVAADGGVFCFGQARYYGSMAGKHLNRPMVGLGTVAGGNGYWLVAADGGVFTFGHLHFYGSMGGRHLNKPMDGMQATTDGRGYWAVAGDGGVFAFGDARFLGSAPGLRGSDQ